MKSKSTPIQICLLLSAAFVIAGCGDNSDGQHAEQVEPAALEVQDPAPQTLADLLASDARSAADRARDAGRKPAEVIAFLGIEPGMHVIDVIAASGYYTEVLSLAVGPEGQVTAQNPPGVLKMRDGANEKALSARLADDRLANVSRLDKDLADFSPEDGPYDAAITGLNLHDIYNRYGEEGAAAAMQTIYAALKPGAVFGVLDHEGIESNDNTALHRIQRADAIRVAEAAGFVLDDSSDILHMPGDDMSQVVFAEEIRGKTNRFLLKLRKPEA